MQKAVCSWMCAMQPLMFSRCWCVRGYCSLVVCMTCVCKVQRKLQVFLHSLAEVKSPGAGFGMEKALKVWITENACGWLCDGLRSYGLTWSCDICTCTDRKQGQDSFAQKWFPAESLLWKSTVVCNDVYLRVLWKMSFCCYKLGGRMPVCHGCVSSYHGQEHQQGCALTGTVCSGGERMLHCYGGKTSESP